ncbi:glycosyltransferase [Hymenobacter sp. HMF4947]|uniref:Peptide O-xylosyltransferase n=1 Tax=Hymenobacter ginkgonis TaxID=2682976 RepID=A0A7K1TFA5_9BACT|nr:beta-1,6-N-acetylglucosaminyltransferase [Hymenobacter ginkgonis]MVN76982.1 glycosyltransferase [Hymenobacter ginkgonis]
MRVAHLIMVHKNPAQVHRLLTALAHESFDFYVHVDSSVDISEYHSLLHLPRVQFTKRRFAMRWASYRFTSAIFECVRDILLSGIKYDFINLLSGQDYPIKPAETIYQFLANHQGYSFLSFEGEDSAWWQHARTRIEQYHTTYFKFRGQYILQNILNSLLPKRQFPLPYDLYGGSDGSWWTMTAECAAYLVDFIDRHSKLRIFSLFTWGSDEFLVATILMNSPFKASIINENYRYIDWSEGAANPKTLTVDDFGKLAQAHKLFARKFDVTRDAHILNLIDQALIRQQPRRVAARR